MRFPQRGVPLQSGKQRPRDTTATGVRRDVHDVELGVVVVDGAESHAADRTVVIHRQPERADWLRVCSRVVRIVGGEAVAALDLIPQRAGHGSCVLGGRVGADDLRQRRRMA